MYDRWEQFSNQIKDELCCVENLINIQRQLSNQAPVQPSPTEYDQPPTEYDQRPIGGGAARDNFGNQNPPADGFDQPANDNPSHNKYEQPVAKPSRP
jgi:hypothetical protein